MFELVPEGNTLLLALIERVPVLFEHAETTVRRNVIFALASKGALKF